MRLNEIATIGDSAFDKLKNLEIFNEVSSIYKTAHILYKNNPGKMAVDVCGDDFADFKEETYNLLQRVKKVYLPTDNTYKRIVEVYKYLNQ